MNAKNLALSLLIIITLPACGGGGGSSTDSSPPVTDGWAENVFASATQFVDQCVMPRSGVDPTTNLAYRDDTGTTTDENNWLRSWSNDTYLWYNEIVWLLLLITAPCKML